MAIGLAHGCLGLGPRLDVSTAFTLSVARSEGRGFGHTLPLTFPSSPHPPRAVVHSLPSALRPPSRT